MSQNSSRGTKASANSEFPRSGDPVEANPEKFDTTWRKIYTVEAFQNKAGIFEASPRSMSEIQKLHEDLGEVLISVGRAYGAIEVSYRKLDRSTIMTLRDDMVAEKYSMRVLFGDTEEPPYRALEHVALKDKWLSSLTSACDSHHAVKSAMRADNSHSIYVLLRETQRLALDAVRKVELVDNRMDHLLVTESWSQEMKQNDGEYIRIEQGIDGDWDLWQQCLARTEGDISAAVKAYRSAAQFRRSRCNRRSR